MIANDVTFVNLGVQYKYKLLRIYISDFYHSTRNNNISKMITLNDTESAKQWRICLAAVN